MADGVAGGFGALDWAVLAGYFVGITLFGGRFSNDVPVAVADMLMAALPMFILYIVGQRYFMHGMVAGAIKG